MYEWLVKKENSKNNHCKICIYLKPVYENTIHKRE